MSASSGRDASVSPPEPERSTPPVQQSKVGRLTVLICILVVLIGVGGYLLLRGPTVEPLEARLRGGESEVAAALDEKLASLDAADRLRLLTEYADEPSPNLRYAAVDALGALGLAEAADAVEMAFADSSSQVRKRAVEVLHTLDRERGFRLLLTALRDEDDWIREAAVMQLMILIRGAGPDAERAFPSLIAAMDPTYPVVCRTAVFILSRVTGKPWKLRGGMSDEERDSVIAQWRAWWATQKRKATTADDALPEPVQPSRRDPAPTFRIRDLDGKVQSLEGLRGKIILVHFYGVWCAACDADMRNLAALDARYAPQGVAMLGVVLAPHDRKLVRKWCSERNARFPQALATDQILEAFGHVDEVPVTAVIDRNGALRYRWEGERDIRTYEAALQRLLAGG